MPQAASAATAVAAAELMLSEAAVAARGDGGGLLGVDGVLRALSRYR